MPTFFLDDEPIEFEKGETILQAALRAGREIPHYCYHPSLKVTSQCRMCLVEIIDGGNGRGIPKLQTSCSTPIAEGMKVEMKNDKVTTAQNSVAELLLVNHPLDCAICDQAGECDLQDYSFTYGTGQSEMEYEKRVYGWRDVGTFIALERNRCIHCSRCERFTADVTGTHDFGSFLRSHELTFDTFEDHQITDKFQGNLADLCPVGCITNRDWRFRKRAWKLERTPSVCPGCSTGCSTTLEHHQNKAYRLKPRENEAVNRWWMCDEGRVGFHWLNEKTTRLNEPMARVGGKLQSVEWDALYQAMIQKFQEIKPGEGEVVALVDTQASNEELHLLTRLLGEAMGGGAALFPLVKGEAEVQPPARLADPFIYSLITTDKSPNTKGALTLGLSGDATGKDAANALEKAKVVVVMGNPFIDNKTVREAAGKAALAVYIGCAETHWAEMADVIFPGQTYGEKDGTYTNKDGHVQRFNKGMKAPAHTRPQVQILAELLAGFGKGGAPADPRAAFDALGQGETPFKGLTWESLGDVGQKIF